MVVVVQVAKVCKELPLAQHHGAAATRSRACHHYPRRNLNLPMHPILPFKCRCQNLGENVRSQNMAILPHSFSAPCSGARASGVDRLRGTRECTCIRQAVYSREAHAFTSWPCATHTMRASKTERQNKKGKKKKTMNAVKERRKKGQ